MIKTFFKKLKALRYYSKKEVDELLTKQREICCERMDDWCDYNKLKRCGHVVLYSPRPK